ncbi:MAG: AcrB/AcrD/AcrF family protein [Elusimicrobia bacterium CG06_land_8_20_14_3_00_38_11]|nr:MAG: AcrB/AcrD/AcrF family protein [Elusimicrobia bacterium CG06_land_8_20_14_3_00_38_11]
MTLPEFSVKRPVATVMFYIAIFVLSIVALSRLALDMFPEITLPAIAVITQYQGAGPEEVEQKITKILESNLAITPDLKEMKSVSKENISMINLVFEWGVNLDAATNDVRDRIDFAKRFLPEDVEKPTVMKFDMNQIPILFVAATAKESYPRIKDILDEKLADPLKRIPGVGNVFVRSPIERQINVDVDRFKLQARGLVISDVVNSLRLNNITLPAGTMDVASKEFLLRIPGEFENVSQISKIPVGNYKGTAVYLKDVADVSDGFKEQTQYIRMNRSKGAIMMLQKKSGANTVTVAEAVKKRIEELKKTLPPDIKLTIPMDTSDDIRRVINNLRDTVIVGGILVILVVFLFLSNFRAAGIICISIPASLIISFLFLYLMGYTINIMSLSAMAIAIGMVVDDAIVVLENIFRHIIELKKDKKSASISATNEVGLAVSAATFATVVVFIPLIFTGGIAGIIFKQLGLIISLTLLTSLFVSLTLIPLISFGFLKAKKGIEKFDRLFLFIEKEYKILLTKALNHRWKTVGIFGAVLLGSLILIPLVGTEFMPEQDAGFLQVTFETPVGTNVHKTNEILLSFEDIVDKDVPEKIIFFATCGQEAGGTAGMSGMEQDSNIGMIMGKLVDKDKRKRGIRDINEALRKKFSKIPGVAKLNFATGDPMQQRMLGSEKPVVVEVLGFDYAETDLISEKIKETMEGIKGLTDVSISRETGKPEYRIEIDRAKITALGLPIYTIADIANAAFAGKRATVYRELGDEYDVFVRLQKKDRIDIADIEGLNIRTPAGVLVPLKNFVKIEKKTGPVNIERKDQTRLVKVEANTLGRSLGKVTSELQGKLKKIPLPKGVAIEYGGSIKEQKESFRDLFLALLLGIFLTYMVMAAQFESFRDPFIIMFSIPFAIVGVIWGLLITGMTLNITSFIGLIMLVGIVVKNAIVFIDYTIQQRNKQIPVYEALLESGRVRLRPILMTSLTTVFGMLPLALSRGTGSETWNSLGVTVIFGLTVSMFITLIIIPVVYSLFEEKNTEQTRK